MAFNRKSLASSSDGSASTYRCPGCGQTVDDGRLDQMIHHHQHVIVTAEFPPLWFRRTPDGSRSPAARPAGNEQRGDNSARRLRAKLADDAAVN